ncbi:MAG TPA: S24/S26 family peptidase [Gemmatimonadaceae bacterium]|nr:S24/S26 family peptidase [Gemmatimonadaceae bacterium]
MSDGSATNSRVLAVEGADFLATVAVAAAASVPVWFRVRGTSMTPAIQPNALVRAVGLSARSARRGDVVVARRADGSPVVHRVWWQQGRRLWLKGDARLAPDAPVTVDAVVAIADRVRDERGERPLEGRAAWSPRLALGRWRRHLRGVVTRRQGMVRS